MKYIKNYESTEKMLEIGDYVICEESNIGSDDDTMKFLSENIGQYVDYSDNDQYPYVIQYEDCPSDLNGFNYTTRENARLMERKEIKYFSKNKEDLLPIIDVNKYNI